MKPIRIKTEIPIIDVDGLADDWKALSEKYNIRPEHIGMLYGLVHKTLPNGQISQQPTDVLYVRPGGQISITPIQNVMIKQDGNLIIPHIVSIMDGFNGLIEIPTKKPNLVS